MSGEFGRYQSGYLHTQILYGAEDCKNEGQQELTRLWGEFLEAFYPIAHSICWVEAGDSHPADTILESIKQMPEMQKILKQISLHLDPYKRVAEYAVRDALEKHD